MNESEELETLDTTTGYLNKLISINQTLSSNNFVIN